MINLFTGIVGALSVYILNAIGSQYKERSRKKTTKKMFLNNLEKIFLLSNNIINELKSLEHNFNSYKGLCEGKAFDFGKYENFHIEIYKSVNNIDLYDIFQEDFELLVDIYQAIQFQKTRIAVTFYNKFIEKANRDNIMNKSLNKNEIELIDTLINEINHSIDSFRMIQNKIKIINPNLSNIHKLENNNVL